MVHRLGLPGEGRDWRCCARQAADRFSCCSQSHALADWRSPDCRAGRRRAADGDELPRRRQSRCLPRGHEGVWLSLNEVRAARRFPAGRWGGARRLPVAASAHASTSQLTCASQTARCPMPTRSGEREASTSFVTICSSPARRPDCSPTAARLSCHAVYGSAVPGAAAEAARDQCSFAIAGKPSVNTAAAAASVPGGGDECG